MQAKTKVIENLAITTAKLANDSVSTAKIIANAVDGTKIRLSNDQYLRARNNADSGDINILKVNTSDEIEADGTWNFAVAPVSVNAPSSGSQLANKTYVDSVAGGAPRESITVQGYQGVGSTNTSVIRFSSINNTLGTNITYTSDSVNGDSFTVLTDGIYNISFWISLSSGSSWMAITCNSSNLTSTPNTLTYAQGNRAMSVANTSSASGGVSTSIFLNANDVIRLQVNNGGISALTDFTVNFTITKVAN